MFLEFYRIPTIRHSEMENIRDTERPESIFASDAVRQARRRDSDSIRK